MTVTVPSTVVPGHQVASGQNGDLRFPGGTIRMQAQHFLARGLEIAPYHPATVNVSIAPWRYRVVRPWLTLRKVRWHAVEPAEDFSFFNVRAAFEGGAVEIGLIYFPHPETKPEHFQKTDVLELLLPWVEGLEYGARLTIEVPEEQMVFEQ